MSINLRRTLRKTLDRLGVRYTEERTGWSGSQRYGYRPILALVVSDDDYEQVVQPDRAKSRGAREAANRQAAARRAAETQSLADSLGVLPGSRTLAAYRRGEIDADEARRVGEITRHRHEDTDYEALLSRGVSRDDARAMI